MNDLLHLLQCCVCEKFQQMKQCTMHNLSAALYNIYEIPYVGYMSATCLNLISWSSVPCSFAYTIVLFIMRDIIMLISIKYKRKYRVYRLALLHPISSERVPLLIYAVDNSGNNVKCFGLFGALLVCLYAALRFVCVHFMIQNKRTNFNHTERTPFRHSTRHTPLAAAPHPYIHLC